MPSVRTLQELATALDEVNRIRKELHNLPPVVIISDEAYHRIVFPSTNRPYVSPAEFYPFTVSIYTYAKTCGAPSERVGWLALSPLWPAETKDLIRRNLLSVRAFSGWLVPSATNARCIPKLEEDDGVRIDLGMLQRTRDTLAAAFSSVGPTVFPQVVVPESGFYMLVRVPPAFYPNRDVTFTRMFGEKYRVLVMCMSMFSSLKGWVRLSLTGNDEMVGIVVAGIHNFGKAYKESDPSLDHWIHGNDEKT